MESRVYFRKRDIDYDNEPDQDWVKYLHENLEHYESWGIHKDEDDELHSEIVKALYDSKDVDASLIEVDVQSGHIFLTGKVFFESDKKKVDNIIKQNFKVWKIESQLELVDRHN